MPWVRELCFSLSICPFVKAAAKVLGVWSYQVRTRLLVLHEVPCVPRRWAELSFWRLPGASWAAGDLSPRRGPLFSPPAMLFFPSHGRAWSALEMMARRVWGEGRSCGRLSRPRALRFFVSRWKLRPGQPTARPQSGRNHTSPQPAWTKDRWRAAPGPSPAHPWDLGDPTTTLPFLLLLPFVCFLDKENVKLSPLSRL